MTVITIVRTGSAAVLAADSRVTTQATGGIEADGTPRLIPQTYDHAVKLVQDRSGSLIAAFAGYGNIGKQAAADYFSRLELAFPTATDAQDVRLRGIVDDMVTERKAFFKELNIPPGKIPQTSAMLAAASVDRLAPRIWRVSLEGETSSVIEILQNPGVWVEGSSDLALTLLYGHTGVQWEELRRALGVGGDEFEKAASKARQLAPINRINFWSMPVQDAIDFAVFICSVQVDMEKFLPGIPACCGPIDVMTLELAPETRVRVFSGKALHHPMAG
jgi:hypothetical protein